MELGSNEFVVMAERFAFEAVVPVNAMGPVLTELTACEELGPVERDSFVIPACLQRVVQSGFQFSTCSGNLWGVFLQHRTVFEGMPSVPTHNARSVEAC